MILFQSQNSNMVEHSIKVVSFELKKVNMFIMTILCKFPKIVSENIFFKHFRASEIICT